ncbi:hypothetical protein SH601_05190 [Gracilibacillus sp. S3-1-1]|uniref:Uncharacterized protein n=1 Tax=Gracilibacillus pellucidus TaxID=3095368 RepID=A0ACC6M384_9BACI|nr:hypothetical protein [Gracilibacillus sp. S3-1-1]MDX8045379.1 hypothetical protein [Gracilibacillus sp. S3-1-1]
MEKLFVSTCNWLGIVLLLLSICSAVLDISAFGSNYIVVYGLSVLGFIAGFMGWVLLRFNNVGAFTKIIGKIGFYGNLAIVILFFPLFSHLWGTFIFGP